MYVEKKPDKVMEVLTHKEYLITFFRNVLDKIAGGHIVRILVF